MAIEQAFLDLQQGRTTEQETGGFLSTNSYPMQFQALEFPELAGDGKVKMVGNDQAFFFVQDGNAKEDAAIGRSDPDKMQLNTSKLEAVMQNAKAHGTQFTLMIDADVMKDDLSDFLDKYQSLRREWPKAEDQMPEEERARRQQNARSMLEKEAGMIRDFIREGGVQEIAETMHSEVPLARRGQAVNGFLKKFQVKGVETPEALKGAMWDVETASGGQLIAHQQYSNSTDKFDRAWTLGTEPELSALREAQHGGATKLLEAHEKWQQMPAHSLTAPPQQGQVAWR